jgi:rare lipoprotein A
MELSYRVDIINGMSRNNSTANVSFFNRISVISLFFLLLATSLFSMQIGFASWYGGKFQGRKTSSGEIYDMNRLTAAHKTLPFGTMVRVTNLKNGKSVCVKVNDRGPFVRGRIIDLSKAAAIEIGSVNYGVTLVRLEILGKDDVTGGQKAAYNIQVASFKDEANAKMIKKKLEDKNLHPEFVRTSEGFIRIVLGDIVEQDLEQTLSILKDEGFPNPLVRKT